MIDIQHELKEGYTDADICNIIQYIAYLTKSLSLGCTQPSKQSQKSVASQIIDKASHKIISRFRREKISGVRINTNSFWPLTNMLLKLEESIDEINYVSDIIITKDSAWVTVEAMNFLYLYGFSVVNNEEGEITGAISVTIQKINGGKGIRTNYLLTNIFYHMDVSVINDLSNDKDRNLIYVEHLPFFDYTSSSVEKEEPTHGK